METGYIQGREPRPTMECEGNFTALSSTRREQAFHLGHIVAREGRASDCVFCLSGECTGVVLLMIRVRSHSLSLSLLGCHCKYILREHSRHSSRDTHEGRRRNEGEREGGRQNNRYWLTHVQSAVAPLCAIPVRMPCSLRAAGGSPADV